MRVERLVIWVVEILEIYERHGKFLRSERDGKKENPQALYDFISFLTTISELRWLGPGVPSSSVHHLLFLAPVLGSSRWLKIEVERERLLL